MPEQSGYARSVVSVVLLWTAIGLVLAGSAYAVFSWARAPGPALAPTRQAPDLATLSDSVRRLCLALTTPEAASTIEDAQADLADAWGGLPDPLRERLMARGIPENRVAELYQAPRPTDGTQRRRLLELSEALAADLELT